MIARFRLKQVAHVAVGVVALVLVLAVTNAVWQQRQFWQGCQPLPSGTAEQSWYQGLFLSFGYPKAWHAGNCRTDSSQENLKLTSRTSLLWWNHQPLGTSTLTIVTEDRGEQTLAKTLAEMRKQPYAGQRQYDTVRVDGQDGLEITDRPDHSANQLTTVIIDKGDRRYRMIWTIRAWTNAQRLRLEQVDGDESYLDQILDSMRLH